MSLIVIDSPDRTGFPSIPLMKIANYHNQKGDLVLWWEKDIDSEVDTVYSSSVFTYTDKSYLPSRAIVGGSGFDSFFRLSYEIENCELDYSIYPDCSFSVQRFSTGCNNNCEFCLVAELEGKINPVVPMNLNPSSEWIDVIDNDFFGNPEWESAIMWLMETKQKINLHGVDARILTDRHAFWLNQLKHKKQIKMAWDNPREDLLPKFREITGWISPHKIMVYILVGFDSTLEENLYRIDELNALKLDPFVMMYRDQNNTTPSRLLRRLARWCNKKQHRGIPWEDYCKERGDRI